jgi:arsenate reductase
MAEGWVKKLYPGVIEAYSAGTAPHGLDQRAVKVMAEAGVDITAYRSKHVSEFKDTVFDLVITVCDKARESCPVWIGKAHKLHQNFDDPPFLSRESKHEEDALAHYRRVRDEIREFVLRLPEILG